MAMDGTRPTAPRPQPLGDETEHYWLVQRMAKAAGVDLVQATEAGLLNQEDWAGIVTRCRTCQWAEGCHRWLDAPIDDQHRPIPEPCVNRRRLDRIKSELEAAALQE